MSIQIEDKYAHFWSDLHLFHRAAWTFRGYESAEAQSEAFLKMTKHLDEKDTLFILGDVSFGKPSLTIDWLNKLRCKKVLVFGNHDAGMTTKVKECFDSVHDMLTVKVVHRTPARQDLLARIVCCHYPLLSWKEMHYGNWHLHGHSHGSAMYPRPCKAIDVGVDAEGKHGPLNFWDVQDRIDKLPLDSFDHHKPKEKEGDWTL